MEHDQVDPYSSLASADLKTMIPVIEEHLEVSKRAVPTGTVRLEKHVEQHMQTVNVPLTDVQWQVERVPVDRVVSAAPPIRHEGETTVYPILEERVVVTRELVLREELRVTRVTATRIDTSSHVVLRERVQEERVSPE